MAVLIAVAFVVTAFFLVPTDDSDAAPEESLVAIGGIEYMVGIDGLNKEYGYVSGYDPDSIPSEVTILASVKDGGRTYPVTHIGELAFEDCGTIVSVTMPSSVTTIEMRAFNECTSLTSVTIPSSVTTIGQGAFEGCSSATITINHKLSWTIESLKGTAGVFIDTAEEISLKPVHYKMILKISEKSTNTKDLDLYAPDGTTLLIGEERAGKDFKYVYDKWVQQVSAPVDDVTDPVGGGSGNVTLIIVAVVVIIAVAGIGAFYFLMMRK